MSKYMGQIMAECDCQHQACEMRGYCMAARIEELELAVRYEADLAQQALDARKELEAKLAKAVEQLERLGFDFESIVGRQLKGQDDE